MVPLDFELAVRADGVHEAARSLVAVCEAGLRGLMAQDNPSLEISKLVLKAKLRVYYAILQSDKGKARDALRDFSEKSSDFLDAIMESDVHLVLAGSDPYSGSKSDENVRQAAAAMQRSYDCMEYMMQRL